MKFALVLMSILMAGCGPMGFPAQDCSIMDLHFRGKVQDDTGNPIANVTILVQSTHRNSCPYSEPLQDQVVVTDEYGQFDVLIEIYQDDFFSWSVLVPKYRPYYYGRGIGILPGNFSLLFPEGVPIVLEKMSA